MALDDQLPQGWTAVRGEPGTDFGRSRSIFESGGASVHLKATTDGSLSSTDLFPKISSQRIPVSSQSINAQLKKLSLSARCGSTLATPRMQVEYFDRFSASLGIVEVPSVVGPSAANVFESYSLINQPPTSAAYAIVHIGKNNTAHDVYIDSARLTDMAPFSKILSSLSSVVGVGATVRLPLASSINFIDSMAISSNFLVFPQAGLWRVTCNVELNSLGASDIASLTSIPTVALAAEKTLGDTICFPVAVTGPSLSVARSVYVGSAFPTGALAGMAFDVSSAGSAGFTITDWDVTAHLVSGEA